MNNNHDIKTDSRSSKDSRTCTAAAAGSGRQTWLEYLKEVIIQDNIAKKS